MVTFGSRRAEGAVRTEMALVWIACDSSAVGARNTESSTLCAEGATLVLGRFGN
jgi:hypothetical protein